MEDVAHMTREVRDMAVLTLSSSEGEPCIGVLAIHSNDTAGKRETMSVLSASTLELMLRLTMVHDVMEGNERMCKSR